MAEEEVVKSEEELLAEWEGMADDAPADGADDGDDDMAAAMGVEERVLDQNEIDSLLGVDGDGDDKNRGLRALLDQNVVNYEKLPMLEVIYDKFERFLSTSLRHFTADNVDVSIVNMTSVRFGDYLNSIPLPAGLVVVNAKELGDYILMVYESQLIYGVVDVLLGGRRSKPARVDGRSFTPIERKIMEQMTELVLRDLGDAFSPIMPITFEEERMEVNPRFAVISQDTNVSILITVRVSLEGRDGLMHFCLPYATLEPIREQLLQQFMGEKFGEDNIWEVHLSQELNHTSLELEAILEERDFNLKEVMKWKLGDTIELDAKPTSEIVVKCQGIPKLLGTMGRADDYKAVRIHATIDEVNAKVKEGELS